MATRKNKDGIERARRGEGNIRELPDGRWQVRIVIEGRRVVDAKSTKTEARRRLRELQQQKSRGTYVHPTRDTVIDYLRRWRHDQRNRLARKSMELYASSIDLLALVLAPNLTVTDLRRHHLDEAYNALKDQGYAPSTIRGVHKVVHQAMERAIELYGLQKNPAERTILSEGGRGFEVGRKDVPELTDDQLHALLEAMDRHWLKALWHLLLGYSLRRGEVLGLCWNDIDFGQRVMQIQRQLVYFKQDDVYVFGFESLKTGNSRRTVCLDPRTVEILQAHRVEQMRRDMICMLQGFEDLAFTNTVGHPIPPRNLLKMAERICINVGLPHLDIHSIRHLSITKLAQETRVDAATRSRRSGHANTRVTAVYEHADTGVERESTHQLLDYFTRIRESGTA